MFSQIKKINRQTGANLILVMVAAIWGGGFIAGKMALTGMTPFSVIAFRYCTGALLCGILMFRRIRMAPVQLIKKGVIIGLIQVIGQSVQLIGLQYTTSANQSFLCSSYVAFVPFISWMIIGKRPQARAFIAGIAALGGIGLISLNGSLKIGIGDSLSVLFAVLFGLQIVVVGIFADENTDVFVMSFFQMLTAGLAGLAVCVALGEWTLPNGAESWTGIVYLAVLNTFVAFLAQNWAQKYARDTTAALLMSLESLFGFLFSVLYYHEIVTVRFLLGSVLCFAAVLLNTVRKAEIAPERN